MDRATALHGGLALVLLLAAGAAWLRPYEGNSDGKVVIVPGESKDLTAIEWEEERYRVKVSRDNAVGSRVMVEVTSKKKKDSETPTTKTFPGTNRASELFEKLAPLEGVRSLGAVQMDKLEALGLKSTGERLVLYFNGTPKEITVGDATYGQGDRYVKVEDAVFLLKSSVLTPLRAGASTIVDKRVLPVEREGVRRLEVGDGSQVRELTQRFPEEPKKAYFADPAVPDQKLEEASRWVDRLLKLRVQDVTDDEPTGPPSLVVVLLGQAGAERGAPLGKLEVWPPSKTHALARSSFFDKSVRISKPQAETLLSGLSKLLTEGH